MTIPSFSLTLVSEREPDGHWEDCTWATGVMLSNFMVGSNRYPATRAEYEGLRFDATGVREAYGDGSGYDELERGMAVRYGIAPVRRGMGWARALLEAPVGSALALQGLYSKLPSRLRLTGFTGGHSFLWIRDQAATGLLYDPLARAGALPVRASNDEMRAYYEGFNGEWIAAYEREAWRDPMIVLSLERWNVPAGTPIYENPGGAVLTKFSRAVVATSIGIPNDHSTDGVNYGWRAIIVDTAALDGTLRSKIGYIKRTGITGASADPGWSAAVKRALLDPTFTGGETVDATAEQIAAATKSGIIEGLTRADRAVDAEKVKAGG